MMMKVELPSEMKGDFAGWFNKQAKNGKLSYWNGISITNPDLFNKIIFTNAHKIVARSKYDYLPFNALLSLLGTTMNETGGFNAFIEMGGGAGPTSVVSMAYYLNTNSGKKLSYNVLSGNIPAGVSMRKAGISLSDDDFRTLCSNTISTSIISKYAQYLPATDGVKYIGVGIIQITGRYNTVNHYDSIIYELTKKHVIDLKPEQYWDLATKSPEVMAHAAGSFLSNKMTNDWVAAAVKDTTYCAQVVSAGNYSGTVSNWYTKLITLRLTQLKSCLSNQSNLSSFENPVASSKNIIETTKKQITEGYKFFLSLINK